MTIIPTKNPRLPTAPLEYNKLFMDQLDKNLGLYFNTVDNAIAGILQNQSNLGIISVKDFGAKGDGTTDDTVAIQAARDYLYSQTTPSILIFPAGIYKYSVSPNWNIQNCQVVAEGTVRLRYTGTGNAFEVIDTSGTGLYNQQFGRFIIEATSSAQNGVYIKNSNHSTFDFNVRGCGAAYAGLRIDFAVCSYFPNFTCSNNENGGTQGWYLSAKPKYGIYIYSISGGISEPTSYCTFINPVVEGVEIGAVFNHSLGNMLIGGTLEGCTDTGIIFSGARSIKNVIMHTDFEANTNFDIDCYGLYNSFIKCDTQKIVIMRSNSSSNILDGGVHQNVYCEPSSANNILKDFVYGNTSLSGSLTDLGANIWQRALKVGDSYPSNGPQVNTTLTISASPYTYTNTYVSPVRVLVGGGTVTYSLIGRTGSALTVGTNGIFTLNPGEYLQIAYSVAPTVVVWIN
jgi:hypothetical protein